MTIVEKFWTANGTNRFILVTFAHMNTDAILQGLNPAQRDAVTNYDSPSLIIAGAGSGKTRVLTSRIAYMIAQGVEPQSILALTFTNKAAEQMRERIKAMIGPRSRYLRMGTFHSVFLRLLRENSDLAGFPPTFTIYDTADSRNLIKTLLKELNLPDDKYKPAAMASRISFAKNCLVTPAAYAATAVYAAEDRETGRPRFGELYDLYCRRCKQNGAMDFDDLLLQTNILLRDHPEVLARYQEQFQYILVDEYQDTNYAQYIIIRRLSARHSRLCVVGDDAQSIYSFRGAKIENILNFRRDYPDALVFRLEQNYRSTQTIVDAANSVIVKNVHRMEKHCFSAGDKGAPVRIMRAYTDREEADNVADALRERLRASGDDWSEAAILYRNNDQSRVLEEALRQRGIPYRIYKGNSFYERKEIKDMLGYFRLIVNPLDDEAFRRIINTPARGIGDTTVARIDEISRSRNISMWETVLTLQGEAPQDAATKAVIRKVAEFVRMTEELAAMRDGMPLYDFGKTVAEKSGLLTALRNENTPEAQSAVDNIEELLNSMQLFNEQREAEIRNGERGEDETASLEEWLQEIMLLTDMDQEEEQERSRVTLMTVHSAKGLEYGHVYVVGLEENLFPSLRALESVEGLEEERRLFYVALTRAKREATLSFAETRFRWGSMEFSRPSRFLGEIDEKYIEAEFDLDRVLKRGAAVKEERGTSAIEELRRRFDYRFKENAKESGRDHGRDHGRDSGGRAVTATRGGAGNYGAGGYGAGNYGSRDGQTPKNAYAVRPSSPQAPQVPSDNMRSIGMRRADTTGVAAAGGSGAPCGYAAGERVEHIKFGKGVIVSIDALASDHKLTVEFDNGERKTLLAKFAKLKKM